MVSRDDPRHRETQMTLTTLVVGPLAIALLLMVFGLIADLIRMRGGPVPSQFDPRHPDPFDFDGQPGRPAHRATMEHQEVFPWTR
jgi:hypothetical protein